MKQIKKRSEFHEGKVAKIQRQSTGKVRAMHKSSRNLYGVRLGLAENQAIQVTMRNPAGLGKEKLTKSWKLNNCKGSHGAGENLCA